jgi:GNAT superfamily N-acetyltransferase
MRHGSTPTLSRAAMGLVTRTVVDGPEAEACWSFYDRAFEGLRARAAQRHALTRNEFDDQMVDDRVIKHIVFDAENVGKPVGMTTVTNDLSAVPLISPEFYAARWPRFYAEQQIWYVGFLAVDPDYHGTGVLAQMIGSICEVIPQHGGVVAADICQFNQDAMLLPDAFGRLAGTFTRQPDKQRLDTQVFWGYEFAPAAG